MEINIGDYVKTTSEYNKTDSPVEGFVTNVIWESGDMLVEIDNDMLVYDCYLKRRKKRF